MERKTTPRADCPAPPPADAAPADQAAWYRAYFARSPLVIMVVDAAGRYVEVNPAACRVSGYTEDELLGMSLTDLLAEESRDAGCAHFSHLKDQGHASDEICWVHKDGTKRWSTCDAARLADDRFVAYFQEVTDRKQMERALRREKSFSEAVIRGVAEGLCVCHATPDHPFVAFTVWNARMTELTGYTMEEINRLGWYQTMYPDANLREQAKTRMAQMREGQDILGEEWEITRANGETRVVSISTSILVGDDGRRHVLALMQDITKRRKAEAALGERVRFERLIADLSATLVGSDADQIDVAVGRSLKALVEFLDVDRANLSEFSPERSAARRMHSFARPGVAPLPPGEVAVAQLPWYAGLIREGKTVVSRNLPDDLPADALVDRRYCIDHGIRGNVGIPLRVGASVLGVLAFQFLTRPCDWSAEIIDRLRLIGEVFASALMRKQVEQALRVSEQQYRQLFNNMINGVMVIEVLFDAAGRPCDHRFVHANPAFERLTGTKVEDHLGKIGKDLKIGWPPEVCQRLYRVALTGEAIQYERFNESLGRYYTTSVFAPRPGHVALVFDDISDRKRAEAALRESQQRQKAILDTIPDPAWLKERGGRFLAVNAAWCKFFGNQADEVLGRTAHDFLPADVAARFEEQDRQVIESRRPLRLEEFLRDKDGRVVWFETVKTPLCNAEGEVVEISGLARDVTDRKGAEQEKLEMERRLLHAQKLESLGILAGGIAHDFNNILAGIMGYADLARRRLPAAEPARADLEVIAQAVQRAADLTRQMLAYSGKGKFRVEALNLTQLVDDSRKMLAMSVSKKAALTYSLAGELPSVQADASQIHQVLLNLVINASEALGDGRGLIAVTTDAVTLNAAECAQLHGGNDLPEGLYVRLEVADTGCGMDQATLARIFDPFFSTKFTGRGLGLAAVHGIMRGHKGAVRVTSAPGQGTTFQVYFPASGPPAPADLRPAADVAWRGSGTVLVVDDEELIRGAAQRIVEDAGFSVLTARDGEEALHLFRRHQPEIACVLLDLTMPKMDGAETFRALRQIAPDVRVILSSGFNEEGATERFAGLGLAGFLQKPYQSDAVHAALRQAVSPAGGA